MTPRAFTTSGRRPRCPQRVAAGALALALAAALGLGAPAAQADQGLDLALTAGTGKHQVRKLGLVLGWTQPEPLWQGAHWRLRLRHEAELATWRVPDAPDVLELGYSPVLRLERPLGGAHTVFFVEGSIGVRMLSHTHVGAHRLSTAFQFSDQLGLGWQWGAQGRHTLGLRLQHISNADIKQPNPGMDFWQLLYRYRF
ncbi:MAG: acyloxyacyl hydrolase [Burkholderiaceae bacterium]